MDSTKSQYAYKIDHKKLTVPNNDDAIEASVTLPAFIFARTGAPNPIEESWRLKGDQQIDWLQKHGTYHIIKLLLYNFQDLFNLSEIVFSKSMKAPPQMKSIFLVSIYIDGTSLIHKMKTTDSSL